jgi:hypothetical protein
MCQSRGLEGVVAKVSPVIVKRWGDESLSTPTTEGEWLGQRKGGSGGKLDVRGVGGVDGVGDAGAASKALGTTAARACGGRVGGKEKRVSEQRNEDAEIGELRIRRPR